MNDNQKNFCDVCGVLEGQFHKWGCSEEPCPFCENPTGQSASSCDCMYQWAKFEGINPGDELTKDKWRRRCEKKGRFVYIDFPRICARCGRNCLMVQIGVVTFLPE